MKKILSCLMALVLTSCATVEEKTPEPPFYNPREIEAFGPYVRIFDAEAQARGLQSIHENLRIYLVDKFNAEMIAMGVMGVCVMKGSMRRIYIDKTIYAGLGDADREMLIIHEMGHCVLGYLHDASTDADGMPLSIMYPSDFSSAYYWDHRKEYLDQFFGKIIKELSNPNPTPKIKEILNDVSICTWHSKTKKKKLKKKK